jgi:aldoxime dehydratase
MTKLTPDDWKPPYPAFVADTKQSHLNICQLGVQAPRVAAGAEDLAELIGLLEVNSEPLHYERVYHKDGQGFHNDILLVYWEKPGSFTDWRAGNTVNEFFERSRDKEIGIWIEALSAPADNFETSYSTGTAKWGISRHHSSHEDPIHGYYGSMRDRIKAAENGGLASPVGRLNRELSQQTRGRHLSVELPENLCFIRTVQGWNACSDEEKEYFMKRTFPVYQRGVEYLRTHPLETNCINARLVTDVAQDPDQPQTETLAWFLSLTDLEAWAWNHPTHAAIFNTFMKHAEKFNFEVDILLGHEVLVVPKNGVLAEYHNCHNATGFLRFFQAVEADTASA